MVAATVSTADYSSSCSWNPCICLLPACCLMGEVVLSSALSCSPEHLQESGNRQLHVQPQHACCLQVLHRSTFDAW
jgi:hypothetical protein